MGQTRSGLLCSTAFRATALFVVRGLRLVLRACPFERVSVSPAKRCLYRNNLSIIYCHLLFFYSFPFFSIVRAFPFSYDASYRDPRPCSPIVAASAFSPHLHAERSDARPKALMSYYPNHYFRPCVSIPVRAPASSSPRPRHRDTVGRHTSAGVVRKLYLPQLNSEPSSSLVARDLDRGWRQRPYPWFMSNPRARPPSPSPSFFLELEVWRAG